MTQTADLIVIGGGIHGSSTALFAALRGMSVIVIEKDTVARHASGVNAGGVRRLGRHLAEVPLSQHSMEIWYGLQDMLGADCGFQIAPQIKVAENEEELDRHRARVQTLNRMGFYHETILDQPQVRHYLPAVADHVVGGLASLRDGFAQPFWTTTAIARKATQAGVVFKEGERVLSLKRETDWTVTTDQDIYQAPKVLNAAGAWAGALAGSLGEYAPVEAIAPMMIVTARLPKFCDAVVGATGRPLSFKQMPNGTVVIGGGRRGRADTATNTSEMLFPELRNTAATAMDIFPIMRGATIVRSWSGVEGRMPDDIPVIGPSALHDGLYHSFGFSAHGFQMGPGTGETMAGLIETGATQFDLSAFAIDRFAPPNT
ncbi:NAD(P)/FAD-dependent oxidoreductase [Donghicola eburneus]|uniref:FAD-dependent oxidoreductase n=1 Tax=Donghicola eburneus TaxID=393278 RepID=A0A1M4N0H8_9RHOB|nr:FAD-dependent oxidoreductase [Donghicola eburneus]SCM67525.1 FAD-dependent oxidoreductase [Donghicola eburneus]SFQ06525.1 sarcosine oxidase subunit beta [Donghicola eburneus]